MYFVYVIRNAEGLLYKGQTDNVEKRLLEHNSEDGERRYTKRRGPWRIVYQETYETRSKARAREKFLKSGQGREFLKRVLS